jgi:hypothetical protein
MDVMMKSLKGLKFSKTGGLILSAGIFVVVLAGLSITRSGQLSEQGKLGTDLASSQERLDKVDTNTYEFQLAELNQQLTDNQQQLTEVKDKLRQKIESVDVSDKFYEIAAFYSVNVTVMGTTKVSNDTYEGIEMSVISLSGMASGAFPDIIKFIAGLNNNFSTGFVQSVEIEVAKAETEEVSTASISLIVYSYEGN